MTEVFWIMWIAIFTTIVLLTYGLLVYFGNRRLVRDRVKRVSTTSTPLFQPRERDGSFKKQFLDWVSSFGKWAMKDKDDDTKVRSTLLAAGFRNLRGTTVFFGLRALAAFILPLPYLLANVIEGTLASGNLIVLLLLAAVGFYLPHYILSYLAKRRKDRIDKALPDVLDLLIVCMEAGLALQAAINRVSEEVKSISKDLYNELQVTNAELRTGILRETALKNLGERTGVQNVKAMVGLMVQSEKMGASIAHSMRTHASFLRTQRALKAEEMAAKLPVKILFPMLLFIFPSIFIVILGPAVIQVTKSGLIK